MSEKKSTETVEVDPGMGIVSEEIDPGMSVVPGPGAADTPTVIPELDSMLAVVLDQLPAYTATDWKNKPSTETPVTAEALKKIEQRIVDLTNAYNNCATEIKTLRDSVSHIDAGVYIHKVAFASGAAIRFNGGEWQTYFLFGSSNIGAIIGQRGTGEPSVVNLSGVNLTAKRGPGASIDVTTTISGGFWAVIRKPYLYTIASHPVSPVVLVSLTPVDVFSLVTPVGISDGNTSYVLRQMPMTEFPQRQRAKESVGISISIVSAHVFF